MEAGKLTGKSPAEGAPIGSQPPGTGLAPGRARAVSIAGLLVVTLVWGSTFVVVQDSITTMPVFAFLAWRFAAGAAGLYAARPKAPRRLDRRAVIRGVLLGLTLAAAYAAQTIGLQDTPAAVSGFITGLSVVGTPLLSWLILRRRPGAFVWLGTLMTAGGLALITLSGVGFGTGELLTLAGAVLFALHIVGLGEWTADHDGLALAQVQIATVAVACTVVSLIEGPAVPHGLPQWSSVVYTGILATAGAYFTQTWAQRHLSAAQTAVVLTMEPVFAAVFAVILGKQALHPTLIAGGALMVLAMYVVDARPARQRPAPEPPAP